MSDRKRIGIVGIGGIGGFVGAPLASYYKNNPQVEILFICRGDTQKVIWESGLTMEYADRTEVVHPDLVSDDPTEIGKVDALIIAGKAYSLESMLKEYDACIDQNTVIITLQNMVNSKEVIQHTLGEKGRILEGCIYVASNVKQKGYVKHVGGPGMIFIGGDDEVKYIWLMKLLKGAGLDVTFVKNIKQVLWKKFLFVAPVAAITTAYAVTFGQLYEDKKLMGTLQGMMKEIQALAETHGIELKADDISTALELLSKFPYEAKSSLQLDVENRNQTEKSFLVDYVVEECERLGIDSPLYKLVNSKIRV